MPLRYVECFGETPSSPKLQDALSSANCPFVGGQCSKKFQKGPVSGSCALAQSSDNVPVICCPKRLYAENYKALRHVARLAFGEHVPVVLENEKLPRKGQFAVPFGQRQGKEIRVRHSESAGSSKFSVDWIIARVTNSGVLREFVAVEVQTIDTTGNYQHQFWDIARTHCPTVLERFTSPKMASSNFNYENVNKRILPQLITKGHILRREPLCEKGLFFVCPIRVFERIIDRVGDLPAYPMQTGSVTMLGFQLGKKKTEFGYRELVLERELTTTTDQLSLAFSSPASLPEAGVYERAIKLALKARLSTT